MLVLQSIKAALNNGNIDRALSYIDNFNAFERGFTVTLEDIAKASNTPMSLRQLKDTLKDVKTPGDNFSHLAGFHMNDTEDTKYVFCHICETMGEEPKEEIETKRTLCAICAGV